MRKLPIGKPLCVLEIRYLHQVEISKLLPNKLVHMYAAAWCQIQNISLEMLNAKILS